MTCEGCSGAVTRVLNKKGKTCNDLLIDHNLCGLKCFLMIFFVLLFDIMIVNLKKS